MLWYDENTGKDKKDEQLTWDSYYSHLQDLSQANSHKETYFRNPHRGLKSGEENTISLEVPLTQLIIKGDLYIAAWREVHIHYLHLLHTFGDPNHEKHLT